jgi:hypothetical protein
MSSPTVCGVRVAHFLIFCAVFRRSVHACLKFLFFRPLSEAFEWTVKWVTGFREWQTFEVARKVGASFRDQLECVRGSKTDTQNKRYFSLKASVAVSIIWLQNGYFCQPQKHELKKWSWIWKFHNALYSISKLRITCFLKEIQCKNITEIQIAMLKSKMSFKSIGTRFVPLFLYFLIHHSRSSTLL